MLRSGLVALTLAACAVAGDATDLATSPAPLVGVDGSADQADRNCNVVLRGLQRNAMNGFTFESNGNSWVWGGSVEISAAAAAEGLEPSVMYQWGADPAWYEGTVTAEPDGATPGFARFAIRLDHDLLGPGMSATAMTASRIEVVPYLRLSGGGRLFDHNRNPSDFDNYVMTYPDHAIGRAPTVCPAPSDGTRANLIFDADFTQRRDGVIAPGGTLGIQYAGARLPTCRFIQGGLPRYDITAHVRFGSGPVQSASVRDAAAVFAVPTDGSRTVAVWFETTSVTGCHAWDSNFGANYVFDVCVAAWVGEATNLITRDTASPCGGSPAAAGFNFETWARQRAAMTNLCFQVYQPGLTDRDDPELWQKLDASVRWRLAGETAWHAQPANLDRRVGNNARYAVSWRALDPFRAYHCPGVATTPSADGQYAQVAVEYYIVVNGVELRPAPGAVFSGQFADYLHDAFRDQNCT